MGTHKHYGSVALADVKAGWTAYTPTVTGAVKGNGIAQGAYQIGGGVVDFYASFTLGTTSSVSGPGITLSLPVTALNVDSFIAASATITDAGVNAYFALPFVGVSGIGTFAFGAGGAFQGLSPSSPFVWGANDIVQVRGSYRPA